MSRLEPVAIARKATSTTLFALLIVSGVHELSAITRGTAKVNGTTLYYEAKGRGFPLVLVSGGGTLDLRGWDYQLSF